VAANGDIFVADGHEVNGNNRVVKLSKDGKFIKAWGKTGYAPGEFRTLHGIAIDSRGRVFVADRNNNRIQLFDQEGKHLSTWTQFGTPSGIAFDDKDQIYVAISESDGVNNPGWEQGIRIGDLKNGFCDRLHFGPRRQPEYPNRKRCGVRRGGQARQHFRRRAPPPCLAEIRQSQIAALRCGPRKK